MFSEKIINYNWPFIQFINSYFFKACEYRSNKAQICGFCTGFNGATSVGPFDVNCETTNQTTDVCASYLVPFCLV